MKLNLDDDIIIEVRKEDNTLPPIKKKWSGSNIILPINNETTILKNIEDTTKVEFLNWLQQVYPLNNDMMKIYTKSIETTKDKISVFESVVFLHARKWLFGAGESFISPEVKWS